MKVLLTRLKIKTHSSVKLSVRICCDRVGIESHSPEYVLLAILQLTLCTYDFHFFIMKKNNKTTNKMLGISKQMTQHRWASMIVWLFTLRWDCVSQFSASQNRCQRSWRSHSFRWQSWDVTPVSLDAHRWLLRETRHSSAPVQFHLWMHNRSLRPMLQELERALDHRYIWRLQK